MAKPKKENEEVAESLPASPSLFPVEKLYSLKLGSVDVPVVEDGRGTWKNVTQRDWNLDYQRDLMDSWKEQAADNPGFSIEAKKAKLFI